MLSMIKKCCSRKLLQCFWEDINLSVRSKLNKKQTYPLIRIWYVLRIMLIPIYDISFSLDNKTSVQLTILFYKSHGLDSTPFRACKAHFTLNLLVFHGQVAQVTDVKNIIYDEINDFCLPPWLLKMFQFLLFLNIDVKKKSHFRIVPSMYKYLLSEYKECLVSTTTGTSV